MRTLAVLLLFLLLGNTAFAAVAVRFDGEAALLEENGDILIAPGTYSDITAIGDDRFAVRIGERYALADGSGALLTGFDYTALAVFGNMIRCGNDDRYAVMDINGNILSEMIYSRIIFGSGENAWALRGDGDQLWVLSPDDAQYAPCGEINEIADTSGNDLLAVRMEDTLLWGYCDPSGRLVIDDAYDFADTFKDGLARAVFRGRFGVIDTKSESVVPFLYESLAISDSLIAAADGDTVTVYDRSGNTLASFEDAQNGFALFDNYLAIYGADRVDLYDAGCNKIAEYPFDAQLYSGVNGGLIIAEGQWGEQSTYLLGAEDERWQGLTSLGTAGGSAVYCGCTMDTDTVYDAVLGQDMLRVDTDSVRCRIVSSDGTSTVSDSWLSLLSLADDRFLAETESQWQMIDSSGNVYRTFEKKVDQ